MEAWEERVTRLEVVYENLTDRLTALERDVAAIKLSVETLEVDAAYLKAEVANCATKGDVAAIKAEVATCATKGDLAEAKASLIMWAVSLFLLSQVLPGLLDLLGM